MVFIDYLKRAEIIDNAMKEFAEHGYEKANTNRICKAANVSKGLIFHHFGSKQNLYISVVEKCIDDILMFFKSLSVKDEDFIKSLSAYYQHRFNFFKKHPMHYKMLMQAINAAPKELRSEIEEKTTELNNLAESILISCFEKIQLKEGVKREMALSIIIMVLNVIESKYAPLLSDSGGFSGEQANTLSEECDELIRLVLYGIAVQ
ncbi:MAG: TetR/AcrR family transcriptional regulator [Bacillota bacterium]